MEPDPSVLGSDILLGPLALLAFIFAAIGYAAREYRKAREARVEDLERRVDQITDERDKANRTSDTLRAEIVGLKETHMQDRNTVHARLIKAREMLVDRGVKPEDLP